MAQDNHDPADLMARCDAYRRRTAALVAQNKNRLMAAFSAAGITQLVVPFDGVGDSGQIEHIEASAGDDLLELPVLEVDIDQTDFLSDEVTHVRYPLPETIECLCYAILEATHCGWMNNGGAYGEFVFDIAAGTIELDFNYRIETSEHHAHIF